MRDALHRLLVLVSGQPDSMATLMNESLGLQHVDTHEGWTREPFDPTCFCAHVRRGGCQQGRRCPLLETEMSNETPATEQMRMPIDPPEARRERNAERIKAAAQAITIVIAVAAVAAAVIWVTTPRNY